MQVVFFSFNNISGTFSRWSTKCDWSHVDMQFRDGTLIGATRHGVEKMKINDRISGKRPVRAYRVDEIELPDEQAAYEFALAQVGKKYDWTALVGMIIPWRVNWDDDQRWVCSELVAATAAKGGRPLARYDAWRINPGFLDSSPLLKTIIGPITMPAKKKS